MIRRVALVAYAGLALWAATAAPASGQPSPVRAQPVAGEGADVETETDGQARARQVEALRGKLAELVDRHVHWQLKQPLAALLDDVDPAVQVEVMLPFMVNVNKPNWTTARIEPAVCYRLGALHEHSMDALLAMLKDEDANRRAAAAFTIHRAGFARQGHDRHPWGRQAVAALAEALADGNAEVRKQAARALGRMGRDAAAASSKLIARLNDPYELAAYSALLSLQEMETEAWPAVPRIRQIIRDDLANAADMDRHPHWSNFAPETLQAMGPAGIEAVPELLMILASADTNAHLSASNALYWIVTDTIDPRHTDLAVEALQSEYGAPAWVLWKIRSPRPDVARALIDRLDKGKLGYYTGKQIARALAVTAPNEPTIDAALGHTGRDVSTEHGIYRALALYKRTGDADRFLAALPRRPPSDDASRQAWGYAIEALGARAAELAPHVPINPEARFPSLQIAMCRAYQAASGQCDRTLGFLAHEMLPRNVNAAHDEAASALQMLGPMAEPAIDSVRTALTAYDDYADSERFAACRVLKAMGPSAVTRRCLPGLLEMFEKPNSPYHRRIAAEALWLLTHDEQATVKHLLAALDERGRNVFWVMKFLRHMGPRAAEALGVLEAWTDDPCPYYAAEARRTIKAIRDGEHASADALTEADFDRWYEQLGEEDPRVGVEAIWRLAEAGPGAHAYIRARARSLPIMDTDQPPDVTGLIRQLDHDSFAQREAASEALGRMLFRPGVRERLKAALNDDNASAEVQLRLTALLEEDLQAAGERWPYDSLPENRRLGRVKQVLWLIDQRAARSPGN